MSPSQRSRMPQAAEIRRLASADVFERGQAYRRRRVVSQIVARGDAIVAAVEGSEAEPDRVTLRIEAGRVREWGCSCPYDWGGACKHVVATLLTLAEEPDSASTRPTLAALIEPLGRDALRELILRRAEEEPDLAG